MSRRLAVGEEGQRWFRQVLDKDGKATGEWQAGCYVRDADGRRRSIRVRRRGKQAAERALEQRLRSRNALGSHGVTAAMTVAQLADFWLTRRIDGAEAPVKGQVRGRHGGPVSPQTLAAYQSAITHIVVPRLGGLRIDEARVGLIDEALRSVEKSGRSTAHARTVLGQMFALAVRHGALGSNPMREVERPRRRKGEVQRLTVDQARAFLAVTAAHAAGHATDKQGRRTGGKGRTPDVHELALFLLSTGCRIGEALAVTWRDVDLSGEEPTVHVAATLVEPRKQAPKRDRAGNVIEEGRVFVERLHRQPITKGGGERTLILPKAAVDMLSERRKRTMWRRLDDPVFANRTGGFLFPNNVRSKLRSIVEGTAFEGVTPHTLRRTVGTLVAHEAGLEVARDVLGHADMSITWRHYVAARAVAPDVRHLLDRFFTPDTAAVVAVTS